MSTGLNQDWEEAFEVAPIDFTLRTPTTVEVEWSGNDDTVDGRFTIRLDADIAELPRDRKDSVIRQLLGKLITAIWQDRDAVVGRRQQRSVARSNPYTTPTLTSDQANNAYYDSPLVCSEVNAAGEIYLSLDDAGPFHLPPQELGLQIKLASNHPAYLAGELSENEQTITEEAIQNALGEIFHYCREAVLAEQQAAPGRVIPPTRRDTNRPSPVLPRQREASHRERVDAARAIIQPWTKIDWENRDQFNPDGGRPIWLEDLTDRQLWDVFNWCVRYAEPLFLVYGRNTATVEIGSLFGNLGWLGGRQLMHGMCQEAARRNLFFPPDVWLFVRDHLIPQMPSEQTQPYRQTRTAELAAEQRRLLDTVRPAVVQPPQSFRRLRLDHLPQMENPAI